jgi:O-antigen/teichoic acid export membrane protein
LNYVDKCISFLLPISILLFLNDTNLYNNIEFIFSISNILIVILDLGLKSYFLYDFRQHSDEKIYIQRIQSYFYVQLFIYGVIGIILQFVMPDPIHNNFLLPFITARTLILLLINFYNVYYRLIDKPQNIFYWSISINILTLLFLYIESKLLLGIDRLFLFFSFQFLFISIFLYKGLESLNKINALQTIEYLRKSIRYAWPLIINVLLVTFINNYGKIYAFKFLTDEDMFQFSYVLRIAMIIQMTHSSITAFYSKTIFNDRNKKINYGIYKIYLASLCLSIIISFAIMILMYWLGYIPFNPVNLTSMLILLYIFLWCHVAYLEQYISKMNRNRVLLYISVFSTFVFVTSLFMSNSIDLNYIAFSMLISISLNIGFQLYFLNAKKVF